MRPRRHGPASPTTTRSSASAQDGAHWLNLSKVGLEGETRPDLGAAVASGSNYHVPEVNLAEGNLLTIAQLQTDSYETRVAGLEAKLKKLNTKLAKAKGRLDADHKTIRKLAKTLANTSVSSDRRDLKRKLDKAHRKASADRKRVRSLKAKLAAVEQKLP